MVDMIFWQVCFRFFASLSIPLVLLKREVRFLLDRQRVYEPLRIIDSQLQHLLVEQSPHIFILLAEHSYIDGVGMLLDR